MSKDNEKSITKPESADLGYLQKQGNTGTENIDQEDIIVPRLKIVQGQTKEAFGADLGTMINNVDGTHYGKKLLFVPVLHFKSNICFNDALEIECRSLDAKVSIDGKECSPCGRTNFTKIEDKTIKPECNKIFNYIVCTEDELKEAIEKNMVLPPLVLSFMSSAIKQGKLTNTAIKMNATRGYPIFSQFFELKVTDEPRAFAKGSAYMPEIKVSRYVTEAEATYLEGMYKEYSKMKIDVQMSEDDMAQSEETVPSNDDV